MPVSRRETTERRIAVRVFLAFAAIYVLWGSTYLAIRVAVATVPALFLLLTCSWLIGEMHPFPRISSRAALTILYLIVAGSILAFTAYVWLLGRMLAKTSVASYAYVNPVIALAIGYWLGAER
jgi:drug/metabolite transporter (DMT)-like permease